MTTLRFKCHLSSRLTNFSLFNLQHWSQDLFRCCCFFFLFSLKKETLTCGLFAGRTVKFALSPKVDKTAAAFVFLTSASILIIVFGSFDGASNAAKSCQVFCFFAFFQPVSRFNKHGRVMKSNNGARDSLSFWQT